MYVIKSAGETAKESIVISPLKVTVYTNKISLKLGYRGVKARKYVRCPCTFYFFNVLLQNLMLLEHFEICILIK